MARRYDDPVEVRTREGQPETFVWRGRAYRVLGVVARWHVRRPWWRAPEVVPLDALELEHSVWRVEAVPGGSRVPGVFDLLEACPWRLVRAWD